MYHQRPKKVIEYDADGKVVRIFGRGANSSEPPSIIIMPMKPLDPPRPIRTKRPKRRK